MKHFVTKTELDGWKCDTPNCPHDHSNIYTSPPCHPDAGFDAMYSKPTGTMYLICRECEDTILSVKVA
jgi:hypothetical protein